MSQHETTNPARPVNQAFLDAVGERVHAAKTDPLHIVDEGEVSLWRREALVEDAYGGVVYGYHAPEEYDEGDLILEVVTDDDASRARAVGTLDDLMQAVRDRAVLHAALTAVPEPIDSEAQGDERTWDAGLLTTGVHQDSVALNLGGLSELPGFSPERTAHADGGDDLLMSVPEAEAMVEGLLAAIRAARQH